MTDDGKISKAHAEYVSYADTWTRRCGVCRMFRKPHACTLVRGTIVPEGVCKFFEPKRIEHEKASKPHSGLIPQPDGNHGRIDGEADHADAFAARLLQELGPAAAKSLNEDDTIRWLNRHGITERASDDVVMAGIRQYLAEGSAAKLRKRMRPSPKRYALPTGWTPHREPQVEGKFVRKGYA